MKETMSSGPPSQGFNPAMPPPPPVADGTKKKSNTWIVLVIVLVVGVVLCVPILGIVVAIAVPSFLRAREISRRNACQEHLANIDNAKRQWALSNEKQDGDVPTWDELVNGESYLIKSPVCPAGGVYTINPLGEEPSCSLSDQQNFPHEFPGN